MKARAIYTACEQVGEDAFCQHYHTKEVEPPDDFLTPGGVTGLSFVGLSFENGDDGGSHNTKRAPIEAGNIQSIRRALESVENWCINKLGSSSSQVTVEGLFEIVRKALAEPPRNCDVGTADEQYARFVAVCHANVDLTGRCRASCPLKPAPAVWKCDRAECCAKWAQMPYEEGGAK